MKSGKNCSNSKDIEVFNNLFPFDVLTEHKHNYSRRCMIFKHDLSPIPLT